ncbi:ATP synthase F0, C subunit [Eubacterium nodatum ATCC 33099]|nr:ATP synthase F0, C subunit [Eubacterium nodatum ATCC 33099]
MGIIAIGSAIVMGLAALGVGIGQGIVASNALQSIARQPELAGKITTTMIVGMAIMETALVLAFVIAILLFGKI